MEKNGLSNRKKLAIAVVAMLSLLFAGCFGYVIYRDNQNAKQERFDQLEYEKTLAHFDDMQMRALMINDAICEKKNEIGGILDSKPEVGKGKTLLMDLEDSRTVLMDLIIEIPSTPQEMGQISFKANEIKSCIKELDTKMLDQDISELEKNGYSPSEGSKLFDVFSAIDEQIESTKIAVNVEIERIKEEERLAIEEQTRKQKESAAIQSVSSQLVGSKFALDYFFNTEIDFASDTSLVIYTQMGGRTVTTSASYYIYTVSGSADRYDFGISISESSEVKSMETGEYKRFGGDMSLVITSDSASGALKYLDIGSFRFVPIQSLRLKG